MRRVLPLVLVLTLAPSAAAQAPWTDEQDTDGDGTIDWRLRVSTHEGTTRQEIDEDGDGDVDTLVVGTYDARGVVTSWRIDEHADGHWDRSFFYTYDAEGRRTHAEADLDGDGAADAQQRFEPACEAPFDGCDVVPTC